MRGVNSPVVGCGALSQCQVKEEPADQITPVVDAAPAGADTDFRYAAKREFDERQHWTCPVFDDT
jgi:hypothetical protein